MAEVMKTYILPGMGADSRMYSQLAYQGLRNVEFINWPRYKNEQSIVQIASRVIKENGIKPYQNVGGSSFGGMVAAEISKHIPLNALFLIGSALTADKVNPLLKRMAFLTEYVPFATCRFLIDNMRFLDNKLVLKMLRDSQHEYIRAMSKALFKWPGNPNPTCRIYAVHGANDRVVFPPDGTTTLLDAGHLIAMTHAEQVASFLSSYL